MPIDSLPGFVPYALAATVLSVHLLVLWHLSGGSRARTKTTPNPEDVKTFGNTLVASDPEAVARTLRVHQNGIANIVPFLMLAFVLVLLGASSGFAWIVFGVFVVARIAHTIAYASAVQPWRSISHFVGVLATLVVAEEVVRALVMRA